MKNRIKEIRKEKKITQQQLAKDLNITRQYISLLERKDNTTPPSLKVANAIATTLGECIYKVFDLDGQGTFTCPKENCLHLK